jgi:four helix bundle protein
MHNFRELEIWKNSLKLASDIGLKCNNFPDYEKWGISSQIRRSAVSIPSNIAEGSARDSDKDFHRFLRIALGSAYELETQLLISVELQYMDSNDEVFERLNKIQKQLFNFMKRIKTNI